MAINWRNRDYEKVILSPDGRTCCRFFIREGRIGYSVSTDGCEIVGDSLLGLALVGEKYLGDEMTLVRVHERDFDETWEALWGEQRRIRNNYREAAFYLMERAGARRILTVRFRVFDEGVALRYELPAQPKFRRVVVADECTEFNVNVDSDCWQIPAYQPDRYEYNYTKVPVRDLQGSVHTPATFELNSGKFMAIHEAALYDYGAMTLKRDGYKLRSDITPLSDGTRAKVELPFNTPWRVLMIGASALDLVTNRMVLNLNDPCVGDFSWVKPLKFLGIWWAMFVGEWTWAPGERHGATTEHALEYIDKCVELSVPGLLVEGWNNGWEGDWLENGAYSDFTRPMPDYDLKRVAEYAHEKGVSLIAHHETVGFVDNYEKQLEAAYEYAAENGIKYIKSGYAGSRMTIHERKEFHHSQVGVRHYQRAVELAAQYGIMLDVHEPIKGTGTERTWPNMMTREGARGQEYEGGALSPSHACILPFTRLLAGGMDYTSGIFDIENSVKRLASTLSRQLAYFVTIPSSMQMAADRPRFYSEKYPEAFRFIREVPVSWADTLPLCGEIGQYYVVARRDRDSDDWYIGGVTNEDAREVELKLDFLGSGEWQAEVYCDGAEAHYRENPLAIEIYTEKVNTRTKMLMRMAAGGGFAIRLTRQ